jgi:hypothetical protein
MATIKSLTVGEIAAWGQAISILVQAGVVLAGEIDKLVRSFYGHRMTDAELNLISDAIIADAIRRKEMAEADANG